MSSEETHKSHARRAAIGNKRPDRWKNWPFSAEYFRDLRARGIIWALGVAVVFFIIAASICLLREVSVPYRPGQYVPQDILSRVQFVFPDKDLLLKAQRDARNQTYRIYKPVGDSWGALRKNLLDLPNQLIDHKLSDIPPQLRQDLDLNSLPSVLQRFEEMKAGPVREGYEKDVAAYIAALRNLVIIPDEQYAEEIASPRPGIALKPQERDVFKHDIFPLIHGRGSEGGPTYELQQLIDNAARSNFLHADLADHIKTYTIRTLQPSYELDPAATTDEQNRAAERVSPLAGEVTYKPQFVLVRKGVINEHDWQLLRAEKEAFLRSQGPYGIESKLGLAGLVLCITAILAAYIAFYQPRIVRNEKRCVAIAALLLMMLLMAQLAGVGTGPLYLFGVAPTILVAMILSIAYDQRLAMGIATLHGVLVCVALDQGVGFFLIIWVGVLCTCLMLDEVRSRSKLIEVGGVAAMAMILATVAACATTLDPVGFIAKNCLYAGAAGISVGFIVLGILPFIEKTFNITTAMTLLEYADMSHPLLRRLSLEAPGTYNHSLQVATLAADACDAIGANSLLARVAAYYHDVGKINKPDYFIENQHGGHNRHINLSPHVSFLIIIGHVKDGVEMAREYKVPRVILPFIESHHGTTLVEYFYDKACTQKTARGEGPAISDTEFRYPGPKPRTREIAVVMIADAVESAARTMREPSAASIQELVHKLAMDRLLEGQFDECDLTMREVELVERSLARSLSGIYHARIAYPSTSGVLKITPPTVVPSAISSKNA